MLLSRLLYAVNSRPTRALARYVAHHPRVTYALLLAAVLLAAKYSHRLRRLVVRTHHATPHHAHATATLSPPSPGAPAVHSAVWCAAASP